tara:strand:- start:14016 stop:14666 length:651 start_codon:yes stop_codon:yes gene_type:complete
LPVWTQAQQAFVASTFRKLVTRARVEPVPEEPLPEKLVPEKLVPEKPVPEELPTAWLTPEKRALAEPVSLNLAPGKQEPAQPVPRQLSLERQATANLAPVNFVPKNLAPVNLVPLNLVPENLVPKCVMVAKPVRVRVVPHGPCLPEPKTLPATLLQGLLHWVQVAQTHAAMLQMHPNGHFSRTGWIQSCYQALLPDHPDVRHSHQYPAVPKLPHPD